MIIGRELIEKMYSENYDEYEDTKLYSTGDDELDDLLEKAFCEGYEYAQREYSLKNYLKAIPRHIKRDVTNKGIALRIAKGGDLTNAEIGKVAAKSKVLANRLQQNRGLGAKLLNKADSSIGSGMAKTADKLKKAYIQGQEANVSKGLINFK